MTTTSFNHIYSKILLYTKVGSYERAMWIAIYKNMVRHSNKKNVEQTYYVPLDDFLSSLT